MDIEYKKKEILRKLQYERLQEVRRQEKLIASERCSKFKSNTAALKQKKVNTLKEEKLEKLAYERSIIQELYQKALVQTGHGHEAAENYTSNLKAKQWSDIRTKKELKENERHRQAVASQKRKIELDKMLDPMNSAIYLSSLRHEQAMIDRENARATKESIDAKKKATESIKKEQQSIPKTVVVSHYHTTQSSVSIQERHKVHIQAQVIRHALPHYDSQVIVNQKNEAQMLKVKRTKSLVLKELINRYKVKARRRGAQMALQVESTVTNIEDNLKMLQYVDAAGTRRTRPKSLEMIERNRQAKMKSKGVGGGGGGGGAVPRQGLGQRGGDEELMMMHKFESQFPSIVRRGMDSYEMADDTNSTLRWSQQHPSPSTNTAYRHHVHTSPSAVNQFNSPNNTYISGLNGNINDDVSLPLWGEGANFATARQKIEDLYYLVNRDGGDNGMDVGMDVGVMDRGGMEEQEVEEGEDEGQSFGQMKMESESEGEGNIGIENANSRGDAKDDVSQERVIDINIIQQGKTSSNRHVIPTAKPAIVTSTSNTREDQSASNINRHLNIFDVLDVSTSNTSTSRSGDATDDSMRLNPSSYMGYLSNQNINFAQDGTKPARRLDHDDMDGSLQSDRHDEYFHGNDSVANSFNEESTLSNSNSINRQEESPVNELHTTTSPHANSCQIEVSFGDSESQSFEVRFPRETVDVLDSRGRRVSTSELGDEDAARRDMGMRVGGDFTCDSSDSLDVVPSRTPKTHTDQIFWSMDDEDFDISGRERSETEDDNNHHDDLNISISSSDFNSSQNMIASSVNFTTLDSRKLTLSPIPIPMQLVISTTPQSDAEKKNVKKKQSSRRHFVGDFSCDSDTLNNTSDASNIQHTSRHNMNDSSNITIRARHDFLVQDDVSNPNIDSEELSSPRGRRAHSNFEINSSFDEEGSTTQRVQLEARSYDDGSVDFDQDRYEYSLEDLMHGSISYLSPVSGDSGYNYNADSSQDLDTSSEWWTVSAPQSMNKAAIQAKNAANQNSQWNAVNFLGKEEIKLQEVLKDSFASKSSSSSSKYLDSVDRNNIDTSTHDASNSSSSNTSSNGSQLITSIQDVSNKYRSDIIFQNEVASTEISSKDIEMDITANFMSSKDSTSFDTSNKNSLTVVTPISMPFKHDKISSDSSLSSEYKKRELGDISPQPGLLSTMNILQKNLEDKVMESHKNFEFELDSSSSGSYFSNLLTRVNNYGNVEDDSSGSFQLQSTSMQRTEGVPNDSRQQSIMAQRSGEKYGQGSTTSTLSSLEAKVVTTATSPLKSCNLTPPASYDRASAIGRIRALESKSRSTSSSKDSKGHNPPSSTSSASTESLHISIAHQSNHSQNLFSQFNANSSTSSLSLHIDDSVHFSTLPRSTHHKNEARDSSVVSSLDSKDFHHEFLGSLAREEKLVMDEAPSPHTLGSDNMSYDSLLHNLSQHSLYLMSKGIRGNDTNRLAMQENAQKDSSLDDLSNTKSFDRHISMLTSSVRERVDANIEDLFRNLSENEVEDVAKEENSTQMSSSASLSSGTTWEAVVAARSFFDNDQGEGDARSQSDAMKSATSQVTTQRLASTTSTSLRELRNSSLFDSDSNASSSALNINASSPQSSEDSIIAGLLDVSRRTKAQHNISLETPVPVMRSSFSGGGLHSSQGSSSIFDDFYADDSDDDDLLVGSWTSQYQSTINEAKSVITQEIQSVKQKMSQTISLPVSKSSISSRTIAKEDIRSRQDNQTHTFPASAYAGSITGKRLDSSLASFENSSSILKSLNAVSIVGSSDDDSYDLTLSSPPISRAGHMYSSSTSRSRDVHLDPSFTQGSDKGKDNCSDSGDLDLSSLLGRATVNMRAYNRDDGVQITGLYPSKTERGPSLDVLLGLQTDDYENNSESSSI